ncbi:MAG TPA: response regulator [Candidatus Baltobacteraceae bacterium]|jgi:signal transduction histidine kinase/CheY-like chemotaxis protein|nr:response regulator [Candidatus Baltobacteraceae bacterium]
MRDNINRRILVIDDNRAIHEDFRKILAVQDEGNLYGEMSTDLFGESQEKCRFTGFELESAFQGQEGLEMVKQAVADGKPYGVAFIDVRMPPGWDGIETTAKLWRVSPELQVVICTAYSDYDWNDIARKLGQSDRLLILKKPFDTVEVLQLAQTLSQKWDLARQAQVQVSVLDATANQRTRELRATNEKLTQEIADRSRAQVLLSAFSTLGLLLSSARTVREAGQIIIDAADRLLGYDACLLDLYSPDTDSLTPVLHAELIDGKRTEAAPDYARRQPPLLARKTIREGGQLVLKGDAAGMEISSAPASILFVPIRNGTAVTGILSIQSQAANAYDQRSLETLQALADHCGGALDRIQAEEALRSAQEQLRQSQKLEAIGQLAGGVAHDFNNLLAVISGNAGLALLEAAASPGKIVEALKEINAASERAANLTRQLLAFSRRQMMRSQPVNLDDIIKNLSKMLKRIIGEDIDLRCNYTPLLPPVQADIGMLEQVLVNLVVNARDAMPDGGKLLITTEQLTFEMGPDLAHPEGRPGKFVCATVKDTGLGISGENLPRIFDPFFTTKEIGKGTGLGLATVYGIVKQHQGWIEVCSQVGCGSSFKIYLPALEIARPAANERAPEAAEPPKGMETVLLVEDEQALRSITRRILERSGYHVLEAGSGPEALKIWESAGSKVDLLLTDVIMPEGITGRKLAEDLLGKKKSLKVIFQSGYGGDVMCDGSEILRQTNSYFLQKPCTPRTLLCALRRCLDGLPPAREQLRAGFDTTVTAG